MKKDKILVVMPDRHFGNLVISLNAIKPLRDQYGSENVAIVFSHIHRDMITANFGLENIIFYSGKFNFRFIQEVRRFKPTISLALEGCSASAWISYVSGAKRRVGLNNRKFSFLFTEAIPLRTDVHRLESYFDIIKKIELAPNPPLISLTAPEKDSLFIEEKLNQKKISLAKPLICIHTGAGKPGKQWPMGNFMSLIDILTKTGNYEVILVGSHTEKTQTDLITKHCTQKVHNFAGQLSIMQLIALFKRAQLMISNDSGPMHMAALSGTPVITLFAPTDDTIWGPLSEKAIVLTGDAACSVACKEKHAHDPKQRCFCAITVDKVMNAVQQKLKSATPGNAL